MARFINPFTDEGFKRIFGQEFSKPVLIAFLNALLEGEREIVDVTFLDKLKLRMGQENRSLIYDILCQTDTGDQIIVEMQNTPQTYFKDRSIFYLSRSIVEQGERGTQWKYSIKACYLIALLNFKLDDIGRQLRTDVVPMRLQDKTPFTDKWHIIYLQLPYFTRETVTEEDPFIDKLIYVLKNMETLNRMPFAAQDAVFRRLEEIGEVSAMTKRERRRYDTSLRIYRDTLAVMDYRDEKGRAEGRAEGLAEGRAEGRKEGRKEGHADVALKMKRRNMPVEDIIALTGLTGEEIAALDAGPAKESD